MLTEKQQEYVKKNYGEKPATVIAKDLNVSIYSVYNYARRTKISKHLNPSFDITDRQEQIILGGILGDGSFKKNGSNYYYRECHATPEQGYMQWKFNELYDLTTKRMYDIPNRGVNQHAQIGIQTVNTPSLTRYAEMSIDEVIEEISELGLMVWFLDDGWIRKNSKVCSYGVSAASFNDEQVEMLLRKAESFGLYGHVVGSKKELSFVSGNNSRLKELMYRYFPMDLDIIRKKINDLQG